MSICPDSNRHFVTLGAFTTKLTVRREMDRTDLAYDMQAGQSLPVPYDANTSRYYLSSRRSTTIDRASSS